MSRLNAFLKLVSLYVTAGVSVIFLGVLLKTCRRQEPGYRHAIVGQLLIVHGIPEAQQRLQISLAGWDKVLITSY